LGFDASVALDALNAGATAAGLCGKGPTVTVVVSQEHVEAVKAALKQHQGQIIKAHMNSEKAKVVI
jgi:shikimate kinase